MIFVLCDKGNGRRRFTGTTYKCRAPKILIFAPAPAFLSDGILGRYETAVNAGLRPRQCIFTDCGESKSAGGTAREPDMRAVVTEPEPPPHDHTFPFPFQFQL